MKTIYAEAQPGKVVLKEKEIPAPGKGEVLLKAKYSAMSPGTENGLLGAHIVPLPTSIGYGASFGGVSALLSMLNSCASGVSVVNIDNGFGAGYLASMINHMTGTESKK